MPVEHGDDWDDPGVEGGIPEDMEPYSYAIGAAAGLFIAGTIQLSPIGFTSTEMVVVGGLCLAVGFVLAFGNGRWW